MTYDFKTDDLGNVTIKSSDGASCFLQGDDANKLIKEIERCTTRKQIQSVLANYDELMVFIEEST